MARTLQALTLLFALTLGPISLAELLAQDFSYTGGVAAGIKVRTTTLTEEIVSATTSSGTPGPFEPLASSELTVHVNAGASDLFVYEIVAQCNVLGEEKDYIDLQARLNGVVRGVLGGPAILQPQRNPTAGGLCSGPSVNAKVAANRWFTRLSGGSEGADYKFTIWWRAVDVVPQLGVHGFLRQRSVTLTRYE